MQKSWSIAAPVPLPHCEWIAAGTGGFYCPPGKFWIDPKAAAAQVVVSHAHGDHFIAGHGAVYATAGTMALAAARFGHKTCKEPLTKAYGESFSIGPVKVTFWPAGHILGSAQLELEYNGQRVIYSGDIGLQADPTCEALEYPAPSPDLLICESTFGEKENHPDPLAEMQRLMEASKGLPLLIGVYGIGKAQYLNHLLTTHFPAVPVLLHKSIERFHEVYVQHGRPPGKWEIFARKHWKSTAKFAALIPARNLSSFANDERYYKVMASGFDQRSQFAHLDGTLEISGHPDLAGLRGYIEKMRPQAVGFWHGYPRLLMKACEAMKIPSFPVNLPQTINR